MIDPEHDMVAFDHIHRSITRVAHAITLDASPGHDAVGGSVGCLTEAVMGITAALEHIANALDCISVALEDKEAR